MKDVMVITGSAGLIGSESVQYFHQQGYEIIGIDNNYRRYFFGEDGSTLWQREQLENQLNRYHHFETDIRDYPAIEKIFEKYSTSIAGVIHCAAQPSHDWAAQEPHTDFSINATGTLNLLEATRKYCPETTFIFTSTNKVYGDTPNFLPLVETEKRWTVDGNHPYAEFGIDEQMSIDQTKHSVFGVSKVAADIMVQEYGRYFGMNAVCFRGGCLTGPAHSGAKLHGFLAYLVKCAVTGTPYTILGYKGKQVRDNIHSNDLVTAFDWTIKDPKPGAVYNIGGGIESNCSILEAIDTIEQITGKQMDYSIAEDNRIGDHIWWISDLRKFKQDYPQWQLSYTIESIIREICDETRERLSASS
ncbi:MAG: NAD-dependent epimerase/dehydratase family protein [Desulfobulbaceae bacterium]|nr:MAG: NAD-dependent epimerase/dehydratase family protein [Desulfobulbaceae bacterium]